MKILISTLFVIFFSIAHAADGSGTGNSPQPMVVCYMKADGSGTGNIKADGSGTGNNKADGSGTGNNKVQGSGTGNDKSVLVCEIVGK